MTHEHRADRRNRASRSHDRRAQRRTPEGSGKAWRPRHAPRLPACRPVAPRGEGSCGGGEASGEPPTAPQRPLPQLQQSNVAAAVRLGGCNRQAWCGCRRPERHACCQRATHAQTDCLRRAWRQDEQGAAYRSWPSRGGSPSSACRQRTERGVSPATCHAMTGACVREAGDVSVFAFSRVSRLRRHFQRLGIVHAVLNSGM
jgi:hypothetical protein